MSRLVTHLVVEPDSDRPRELVDVGRYPSARFFLDRVRRAADAAAYPGAARDRTLIPTVYERQTGPGRSR